MSIGRNSAYNVLGAVTPLVLALVTIPIYLHLVGPARYGALAIAWLILGYFGMFDMGFGRATTQRLAALHDSTPEHRARVLWTAAAVNFGIGLMGAALLFVSADYFFRVHFKIDPAIRDEIIAAIPYLAASVPIATLSGVMTGALQGREKFLEVNLVTALGTSLFQIFPLIVAWVRGPEIKWLIIAAVVGRLAGLALLFRATHREMLRGHRPVFDVEEWWGLLKFGSWVSVTMLIGPALLAADRLMIGSFIGGLAVATYAIAFDIAQRTSLLPKALAQAIFPRIAQSDAAQSEALMLNSLKALNFAMTPLILFALFAVGPFLELWVGTATGAAATRICQVLLVAYWINAFAVIPYARLQAEGRPEVVAWITVGQVPAYLAALYLALEVYGLGGVAWVVVARCLIEVFVMFYYANRGVLVPGFLIASIALMGGALVVAEHVPALSLGGVAAALGFPLASLGVAWMLAGLETRAVMLTALQGLVSKVSQSRKG
jgi:O-antigen/teichoic acid export membrane protein